MEDGGEKRARWTAKALHLLDNFGMRTVEVFDEKNSIYMDDKYDTTEFEFFPSEKKFKLMSSIKDDVFYNYQTLEYKLSANPLENRRSEVAPLFVTYTRLLRLNRQDVGDAIRALAKKRVLQNGFIRICCVTHSAPI